MKIKYLFPLLLLVMLSCAANTQSPGWINKNPSDSAFYTAIVKVDKKDKAYRETAQDKALKEISMQIVTQIESTIRLSEEEAYGQLNREYSSTLKAISNAEIRNLQLYDSFETKKDYYAYYRLNKAEYHAQRRIQCERALYSAYDLLKRYESVNTDLMQAAPLLLQALENLVDYLDLDLVYRSPQGDINVYNQVLESLRSLPQGLKISFERERAAVVSKISSNQHIRGMVSFNGTPAPNIPLKFSLLGQSGDILESLATDKAGNFDFQIRKLNSGESPQRVMVELDRQHFVKYLKKEGVQSIWNGINFAPGYLWLDVKKPQIYLDYSFISAFQNGLRENVANQLATLDLGLAQKKEDAQYLLKVRIVAKDGEYLSNLKHYTSYGDIQLSLQDSKTGSNINYIEQMNMKSGGKSKEAAQRAVELDAVKAIGDGLLYRLLYESLLQ